MQPRSALFLLICSASCVRYGYSPGGDAPRASETRPHEGSAPDRPRLDAIRDGLRRDGVRDDQRRDYPSARDISVEDLPPLGAPWSKRFGGPAFDSGYSVAVDKSTNIFLTGPFNGPISFGGGVLSGAGGMDCFLASFDQNGNHRWSQRFGTTTEDYAESVAVDGSGNVAIAGVFDGSVSFGGTTLVSAGGYDAFVASYTSAGGHRWSKRFGSATFDSAYGVAFDAGGNAYITGEFSGSADFGGGTLTSAGSADIFLASYTSTGVYRWAKRFGSAGQDHGWGIAVDGAGNVTIGGVAGGAFDLGGGALGPGIFLGSFTSGGAHRWSRSFFGTGYVRGIACDPSGNVTATGGFSTAMTFGGGSVTPVGGSDIYVASYGPTGSHRWVSAFGSTGSDIGWDVAADGSGNVTVVGEHSGSITFPDKTAACAGGSDIVIISLSSAGAYRWAKTFGSAADDYGHGVAAEVNGQLAVTGKFAGTVDFGQGPLTSAGGQDVMLLRLLP